MGADEAAGGQLVTAFACNGGGGGAFHENGVSPTLSAHGDEEGAQPPAVAFSLRRDPGGTGQGHNTNYISGAASVRRLAPVECERLQALPDGWTDLGGTADSKRYAALGDAVTASVGEWIGRRFQHIQSERAA
jgi:DNA (cytosine-5)-methyltransferase 1